MHHFQTSLIICENVDIFSNRDFFFALTVYFIVPFDLKGAAHINKFKVTRQSREDELSLAYQSLSYMPLPTNTLILCTSVACPQISPMLFRERRAESCTVWLLRHSTSIPEGVQLHKDQTTQTRNASEQILECIFVYTCFSNLFSLWTVKKHFDN